MRWWPLLAASACAAQAPELLPAVRAPAGGAPSGGALVLRCTPADAEVWLDGVPQGTCEDFDGAPKGLALGKGARRVEVKKRGFEAWETYMDGGGTRVVMVVDLVPNERGTP